MHASGTNDDSRSAAILLAGVSCSMESSEFAEPA